MPVQLDLADVKPSVQSFVVVGLMAILFIALAKVVVNRWKIPGLTDLVNTV
jgi:hypothetical protein